MTTLSTNGRSERKSLASQLDRLDRILDGLADGLNEAVATAVKEAVVVAVEAAVRELLASADLQRRLHPEPADRPGLIRRTTSALGRGLVNATRKCWGWVTMVASRGRQRAAEAVAALREGHEALVSRARRGLTTFARRVWLAGFVLRSLARRFRRPLLVALASGLLIGLGCYLAGPTVASTVSGLAGFAGTLIANLLGRLRRVLRQAALQEWYVGRLP
jgi:hypothetical protein